MESLEIVLPYPPTVNHYWGRRHTWKRGRILCQNFIKKEGNKFHEEVKKQFFVRGLMEPFLNNLAIEIEVYPPDKRIRDIDNLCKALLDSFEKANIIKNDNQVHVLLISKKEVKKPKGEVKVKIKTVL